MHSLEKLKENSVWYDANLDSLLPQYRGRYIAISEGAITERAAWWGEASRTSARVSFRVCGFFGGHGCH